jgi:ABC-type nitrate/sulfonate/bicarbonate transport system substrate-binding protein
MKRLAYITICGVAISLLLQGCNGCNNNKNKKDELTLADASVVWWMAPGIIAQEDSIYSKNNLTVNSFDVQTGLASKNAVISGTADIGLVASTPLAMGAFAKDDLIVLCSYIESSSLLSVITPKTKDTTMFSIPQTPISFVKGTISEIYLYNYLEKYYPAKTKEILNSKNLMVKPPDVPATMVKNGGAKSAVIWEPFGTVIASDTTLKVNSPEDIYTHRIYIITTKKVLEQKRNAVEKFVKSIEMACNTLKTDKERSQNIIKSKFSKQEKSMLLLWDKVDFSLKFDYENMKALILKDADVNFKLGQTPNNKQLTISDIQYYFDHNFKKSE